MDATSSPKNTGGIASSGPVSGSERLPLMNRVSTWIAVAVAVLIVAAVIGIVLALSLGGGSSHSPSDPVYAVVGGKKITKHWYNAVLRVQRKETVAEIQNLRLTGGSSLLISQLQQQQRKLPKTVFNNMIGSLIIEQRGSGAGAKTSAYYQLLVLNALIQQRFGGKPYNLVKAARVRGLTYDQYREYLLMLNYNFLALGAALSSHAPTTGVDVHLRGVIVPLRKPLRSSYPTAAAFHTAMQTYDMHLAAIRKDAVIAQHRLSQGQSWSQIIAKVFPSSARYADLGWHWVLSLPKPLRVAAQRLPAASTGVVASRPSVEVMQVSGHKVSKLTSLQRVDQQNTLIKHWLHEQESSPGYVVRHFSPR